MLTGVNSDDEQRHQEHCDHNRPQAAALIHLGLPPYLHKIDVARREFEGMAGVATPRWAFPLSDVHPSKLWQLRSFNTQLDAACHFARGVGGIPPITHFIHSHKTCSAYGRRIRVTSVEGGYERFEKPKPRRRRTAGEAAASKGREIFRSVGRRVSPGLQVGHVRILERREPTLSQKPRHYPAPPAAPCEMRAAACRRRPTPYTRSRQ